MDKTSKRKRTNQVTKSAKKAKTATSRKETGNTTDTEVEATIVSTEARAQLATEDIRTASQAFVKSQLREADEALEVFNEKLSISTVDTSSARKALQQAMDEAKDRATARAQKEQDSCTCRNTLSLLAMKISHSIIDTWITCLPTMKCTSSGRAVFRNQLHRFLRLIQNQLRGSWCFCATAGFEIMWMFLHQHGGRVV